MLLLLLAGLVVTLAISPWLGRVHVGWSDVAGRWRGEPSAGWRVFASIRVPRTLMAALAGGALAVAGVVFQAMFRNPLASPLTLGVSSGAALAAAIAFHYRLAGLLAGWFPMLPALAFVGAMATVVVVYLVWRLRRGSSTATLLLAGVSIGFVCSAVILLIEFLSERPVTNAVVRWLMGSVEVPLEAVLETTAFVVIGLGLVWYLHRDLDLLMMGELVAASRGVAVGRSRMIAYFAASLIVAAVVARCGPIGFVGLVVPHIARALCGPVHRTLIPASLLGGAVFLIWSDTLARNVMGWWKSSALEIPVGVLTSLIGGVFFLYILMTRREESAIS